MPFGLKNASAIFQRLMNQILSELQRNNMFVYLDDFVIYWSPLAEHQQNSINAPNDYDRQILSYNQTNVSFCKKR